MCPEHNLPSCPYSAPQYRHVVLCVMIRSPTAWHNLHVSFDCHMTLWTGCNTLMSIQSAPSVPSSFRSSSTISGYPECNNIGRGNSAVRGGECGQWTYRKNMCAQWRRIAFVRCFITTWNHLKIIIITIHPNECKEHLKASIVTTKSCQPIFKNWTMRIAVTLVFPYRREQLSCSLNTIILRTFIFWYED